MTTLTDAEIVAIWGTIGVLALVLYVLLVIAGWKIFKKAGEPGWKSLIPIYNIYIFMKIVDMGRWFFVALVVGVVAAAVQLISGYSPDTTQSVLNYDFANHPWVSAIVAIDLILNLTIEVLFVIRLPKAFGHGLGYTIGLIVFPNIFLLILGFGKSKYSKKALKA